MYTDLNRRFEDIVAECTRDGYLDVHFSALEIYYHPATPFERRCDVRTSGHIRVEVAGRKSSKGVYDLSILTSHYISWLEICPDTGATETPLRHEKSRVFEVSLDSDNDFAQRVKANGDEQWTLNVELVSRP